MPRHRLSDDQKRRRWAAILRAAMAHHGRHEERGMGRVIAHDAGVTPQSVSDWKNLHTAPEEPQLLRLASVYGVSVEELAGGPEGSSYIQSDEFSQMSIELTGAVTKEILPEASVEQFLAVMERAHQLLLEGRSEDEAYGLLFKFAAELKRQSEPPGSQ